jgi:hypothetical protein
MTQTPSRLRCRSVPWLLLTALTVALVVPWTGGCRRKPTATPAPAPSNGPASAVGTSTAGAAATPVLRLTDVTEESGLDTIMVCGETPTRHILEVNGGGLGLIDHDGDGDLDLFVANGATMQDPEAGPGSRLYENLGNLRFRDVTADARIELRRWAMGAAVGDYDGDGLDDLYVACYGPNVLLRNQGDGTFEDVTEAAGVGDERWGTSTAFGDLDGDGDLDLYVVNYLEFDHADPPGRSSYKGIEVMAGPHGLPPVHDVLYENLGDGTFRDITEQAGCVPERSSFGLNLVILDFDHDGHQDVFVGNDSMANFLYHNDGDGTFTPMGMLSGVAANSDGSMQATMGIAVGDVDDNGLPDLFTTNFSSDTNTLHLNIDGTFFEDRTQMYGLAMISRPYLGWACSLIDLDHDGDEDLIMFNGHVYAEATFESMDSEYEQEPLLFERRGRRFVRLEGEQAGEWLGGAYRARCAAFGDLDRDGDVDVVFGELNGPVRLLRNDRDGGHWLVVSLQDDRSGTANHRGLGSHVALDAGDRRLTRWIFSGGGFQSSSAPEAHFGLRSGEPVRLTVTWPDGIEQTIDGVEPNQHLIVRRGDLQ